MRRFAGFAAVVAFALATTGAQAAKIEVTRTGDPKPGKCKPRDCSLREAVLKANRSATADTIVLRDKTYRLTREGDVEEASLRGDLDVLQPLKVRGKGARATTVQGAWADDPDRLFDLAATRLVLAKMRLTGGEVDLDDGGAVRAAGTTELRLARVTAVANRAEYGGAIATEGTKLLIGNSRIAGNTSDKCCGGGYSFATTTILRSTFNGNTAGVDSGGLWMSSDDTVIRDSTISRNTSTLLGGGLTLHLGAHELTNVTVAGNGTAGEGGGIYLDGQGASTLNNVTIASNDAAGGGGIYSNDGDANLRNTILAANTATSHPACEEGGNGDLVSGGWNLLAPLTANCNLSVVGTDVQNVTDPKLLPLADNGGPTETVALRPASDAVDAGSTTEPGTGDDACAPRDQRGVERPRGPQCDIGAFER